MMHLMQLTATSRYWQPLEQRERERAAQRAALLKAARRGGEPTTPEPARPRSFVPRLAGALGLV